MATTSKKREISVIERRLKSGHILTVGSRPIPLAQPHLWTVRIVNTQISDARAWDMQAEKGWEYLSAADLAVKPEEIGFREQDGRIVRGTQGAEVLMKMRLKDYAAVQRQKDADNRKNTFGAKAIKQTIVGAAQAEPDGARGAEFLDQAISGNEITDSLERVSLED